MGLDAKRPLLLITGGSQGATGLNHLLMRSLPSLKHSLPELQYLHLTGSGDFDKVRAAYQAEGLRVMVRSFLTEMELALAAATVAVSRAGGSSLAELAAMRLPAILIPFPFAADDHQSHNALAFVQTGAAWMLPQHQAAPELFLPMVKELVSDESRREAMKRALAQWHRPGAAASLAETITRPRDVQANPMAGAETASRFLPRPEPSELNS
jgi:UDP-N-acetylglucosamine--N-acetylmuramyl-(pentapeptide) pyrophosphoryl-undecaprenol N-acetylglucosamine transferase